MEPRIQYAKTTDGVSIAYWTLGEGRSFVYMPDIPFSNIQLEWRGWRSRRWYERLAERRRLVRYDGRGVGLSEREVTDFSLDAQVLDLEAVVDRLELEKFALFATVHGGPIAIAYAARHPEQVSHLFLWLSYARGSELRWVRRLGGLMDKEWEVYTETVARSLLGWSEGKGASRYAEFIRESIGPEGLQRSWDAIRQFDASDLLGQVRTPTLVVHPRQFPLLEVGIARNLAARIPDAQLTIVEGTSPAPQQGDAEAALQIIDEFLGEGEEAQPSALPEGMAVILFADIVESTALTEQLGDAAFREKARELDTSLRTVIRESGGTPVEGKLVGDGVLAVFTSARQAIECALRCNGAGESVGLQLHLGIHAGDVIREGNNVYGGAVNIAARIAGASAPGEVLVSDTVRGLARTSAGVAFDDRGEQSLKGVADPQRLFAVRGGGAS